jgi:subtilase family serine protease
MTGFLKLAMPLAAVLAIMACNAGGSSNLPGVTTGQSIAGKPMLPDWILRNTATPACKGSRINQAQCDVLLENAVHPNGGHHNVSGWTATQLESYYKLPYKTDGAGQIVAVVDAYDNPNVASDLGTYRSMFGLGTANFTKYNQNGQQSNYPRGSTGWGVEIDLDTQMVSVACPLCAIYLVEANSSNWSDLETAEKEAVTLGATIVTNSYGGSGASESDYDTPGITYLASAGDSGYGLEDPATFQSVVAAGGTQLFKTGQYNETVWNDSGGGCSSTHEAKPSWQTDPDCPYRTGNDASALAANAAEYDSYSYGGWITVDGTSISSPLLAGVFGLAGNATSQDGGKNLWMLTKKQQKKDLHYVKAGADGGCNNEYLCKAGTKQFGRYSGPGGWGTPNGIGAF